MPQPHPQYRHLVVKSGTTAGHMTCSQPVGQADVWSDVPSPSPPTPPVRGHLVAKSSTTSGQHHIWVTLTCSFEGTSGASSQGNSRSMSRY